MVWNKLTNWFKRTEDPIQICDVYIDLGCTHIDGFLCDTHNCSLRKDYAKLTKGKDYDRFIDTKETSKR